MSADAKVLRQNVAESCERIRQYVVGLSNDEFLRQTQVQDAVHRRIEIIGEAVKNQPTDLKDAHADIPWRQIARMRDHLIHRYVSVDLDLTWQTIESDTPDLERRITAILDALP